MFTKILKKERYISVQFLHLYINEVLTRNMLMILCRFLFHFNLAVMYDVLYYYNVSNAFQRKLMNVV